MDIEEILQETLEEILKKIGTTYKKIKIEQEDKNNFTINIESEDPSLLIGYHGENIQALQHLLKVIAWKKTNEQFNVLLDVDDYRKRQEENVIKLAERKVDQARSTRRPQKLPPMSAYFRRKVHLHCMGAGFDDIETLSQGEGDLRYIIIRLK